MLRVQKHAPSGTIVLDHPQTHNALSRELIQQLIDAFSDFHREKSVRCIILSASGSTFCSGVNLKEWHSTSKEKEPFEAWQDIATELQELVEVMLRLPKPIIAAVDGPALGMGLALVLASDLVIASKKASFTAAGPRLGLVSGLVCPLLAFRCGGSIASRLALGGESIDADEAHRIHLVHRVTSSDQIWVQSHEWAKQISAGAAESIQLTKRLLNEMVGESVLTQLFSGAAVMATACNTDAAVEGITAFVEKRPPTFP